MHRLSIRSVTVIKSSFVSIAYRQVILPNAEACPWGCAYISTAMPSREQVNFGSRRRMKISAKLKKVVDMPYG
jgi:hypothetical protein